MANIKAGDDELWVCLACGKVSNYRYGFCEAGDVIFKTNGWDESCMLNSSLYKKSDLIFNNERVVALKEGAKNLDPNPFPDSVEANIIALKTSII